MRPLKIVQGGLLLFVVGTPLRLSAGETISGSRDFLASAVFRKEPAVSVGGRKWKGDRTVHACRIDHPPTIDGILDEPGWQRTEKLTGFRLYNNGNIARRQTVAQVCFDEHNLYLGICCSEPEMHRIVARAREHDDGRIYDDDTVEIFLDSHHDYSRFLHLTVNSNGAVWDARGEDSEVEDTAAGESGSTKFILRKFPPEEWNPRIEAVVKKEIASWTLELKIPASDTGLDAIVPGTVVGLNICRSETPLGTGAWGSGEISSWAFCPEGFQKPGYFGRLFLGEPEWLLDIRSLGNRAFGENLLRASVTNRTAERKNMVFQVQVGFDNGREFQGKQEIVVPGGKSRSVAVPYFLSELGGVYTLTATLTEKGSVVPSARAQFAGTVPEALALDPAGGNTCYAGEKTLPAQLRMRLGDVSLPGATVSFQLVAEDSGAIVKRAVLRRMTLPTASLDFTIGDLPRGRYLLRTELRGAGRQFRKDEKIFIVSNPFDWQGEMKHDQ